jgi:uncharacterized protein
MFFEDKFIYHPAKYPEGVWDIQHGKVSREDITLTTEDKVSIHGWYSSPNPPMKDSPVILWLHGNGGNITTCYPLVQNYVEMGFEVFIIDYRGYGRSSGRPTEEGIYKDARAAWDYLLNERKILAERIVIQGVSLGGAPAIELSTRVNPAGLIVQCTFTSIADMARIRMPFVPGFLVRTRMDSIRKIASIRSPKLIIHSTLDEVVPFWMGRKLYEAASEPKHFLEVPDAYHNDVEIAGGSRYYETVRNFVTKVTVGRAEANKGR